LSQAEASPVRRYGRYQILAEIGRGPAGIVYKAADPVIGRTVALKVLSEPPGMLPDHRAAYRARLRAEAERAGALQHPHIATIYDVGEDYLVMELLEGRPLGASIGGGRRMDPGLALRLARELADALDFAHARGVAHRALKPGNVMVLPSGQSKLVDFGMARPRAQGAAARRDSNTDAYASPEHQAGRRADARSDVYSLAVLVHEMLTGETPRPAAARRLWRASPPAGSPLEAVLRKALSPRPADRHQSAGELVGALELAHAREEHALASLVEFSGSQESLDTGWERQRRRLLALVAIPPAPSRRRLALGVATLASVGALAALSGGTPRSGAPSAEARLDVAAKPHPPAPGVAKKKARSQPRRPEPAASAPAELAGSLLVSSTPSGARVRIDGVEKGVTPLVIPQRAGLALVRVELPGYHTSARLVWVFPGSSAGISIPLRDEPERHAVDLLSLPDGAELMIDGEPAGRTNVVGLQLAPGFHVIALRRRGFLPWLQEIEVPSGAGRVIATLQSASAEEPAAAR
jgi:serine/threonine-protein kinase